MPLETLAKDDLVLEGDFVRLEPLSADHADDLAPLIVPSDFAYFLNLAPKEASREAALTFIEAALAMPASRVFAIIELKSGKAIGFSSYLDIRPSFLAVEIGLTWIAAPYRRTAVNPEIKKLMLAYAFEELGCVRVCLKTDSRNLQSQRAIEKLGAKKDGVLRKFGIAMDGFVRDTVMYSVLPDEWPTVKAGLETRLVAFQKPSDV